MGITNNIPPSRLIQPGVIDNTAARPASPFEGQCIFQKDTDQLLVWNGSAWVMPNKPAQNPDGLELIKTQTFSNASSTTSDVGVFSSTYQDYVLVLTAVNSSSNPQDIYFNFMNGATFINGADYFYGLVYITSTGGPTRGYQSSQTNARMIFGDDSTGTSELTITKPNQVKKSGLFSVYNSWGSSTNLLGTGYGFHNVATSYDGFRLTFTGTNATGSWSLYGKRI